MSLIRTRRERRQHGARVKRPMSAVKLVGLLLLVVAIIWWLGRLT